MLFNSPEFLLGLLPVSLVGFFCLGQLGLHRTAILWLTIVSLVFYGWWNVSYVPLLLCSVMFNFFVGEKLRLGGSRRWLIAGVSGNVILLGYYKYTGFLAQVISDASGLNWAVPHIVLPLAISFFTFQQIAYLVDCRAGLVKESSLLNYAAFIMFFPHLIAGPITHHKEMIPQFQSMKIFKVQPLALALGATIFLVGLFKKVAIADFVAQYANPVFDAAANNQPLTAIDAWIGAMAYTLQLYFDFSGYSDMAIGAGLLFGIRLPQNFSSPLKAANIVEFWQRWHMTLTRFITSYIYNPIVLTWSRSRARRKLPLIQPGRTTPGAFVSLLLIPVMLSMSISGIWHGAGYQFLLWGILHGIYLVSYHLWRELKMRIRPGASGRFRFGRPLGIALTLTCVVSSMVLFRSVSATAAMHMFSCMFGANGIVIPQGAANVPVVGGLVHALGLKVGKQMFLYSEPLMLIVPLLVLVLTAPNIYEWMNDYDTALMAKPAKVPTDGDRWRFSFPDIRWRPSFGYSFFLGILAFVTLTRMVSNAPSEFIYFRF
jgi:D-alanyl-lipoteichoic acid acyltransferase DltB (MBOAT superfamily)